MPDRTRQRKIIDGVVALVAVVAAIAVLLLLRENFADHTRMPVTEESSRP
ncbi:hypothetical protein [Microvirga sp. M2]